jgi:hypothetical protein
VDLLKVVYPQLKAIDPTITVLASGIASGDATLTTAIQDGETTCCDGVDLHTYDYTYPDPYADIETWYNRMLAEPARIAAANNGQSFPLFVTEMGWPTQINGHGSTQEEESQYLARFFILGARMPFIKGLHWYNLRDIYFNSTDPQANYGVLRSDCSPKLA